jgi:hypothetical protein
MEERLADGWIPRMRSGIADLCDGERSVMTTYYLQQHEEDGRWLIDSTFPQEVLLEKFEKSLTTKEK